MKKNLILFFVVCFLGSLPMPALAQPDINHVVLQYMAGQSDEAMETVLEEVANPRQKNCLSKAMECSLNKNISNKDKCGIIYNQCMAKKQSS
ncbi:MAG: hypothetical protein A3G32_09680 [Deltaproteobacteria bacterium RIFCSPLOWO2_12_FULL_40_28]|nr:MAG: hypothetical protein A3C45_04775 [Deltaproteobacteria bacterium RIFCSPHIGHO2_02_FULL_40_28]OGQ20227.1 MAG: hypothetical protein A3E27_06055 [Deltaproteobacteria bacterium RIFCSPHIGHO2_12_FULL_40_32]OGQ40346.1 MAG: hypothetical protein A3I69_08935 [Deltaproteobacteria bacterium RIFCSPLOWO2_02_FULL_40_36]OGQ54800.1 MAG: hypothetical protein A3G32_09680 [Deltaproteobacteria bacterium RIFCSPLOWO2_12_FULL_40_28]